jgi:hypothetical protein
MRNGRAEPSALAFARAFEAAAMPTYRCYLLNYSDNIVSVDSVRADEDEIAMVMASGLLREQHPTCAAMEVWERSRRLGRIENDAGTLRSRLAVKGS